MFDKSLFHYCVFYMYYNHPYILQYILCNNSIFVTNLALFKNHRIGGLIYFSDYQRVATTTGLGPRHSVSVAAS